MFFSKKKTMVINVINKLMIFAGKKTATIGKTAISKGKSRSCILDLKFISLAVFKN